MPTGHAHTWPSSTAGASNEHELSSDAPVNLDALGTQCPELKPAVQALLEVLAHAHSQHVPHVHLEPTDTFFRLRLRYDTGLDETLLDRLSAFPQAIQTIHAHLCGDERADTTLHCAFITRLADGVQLVDLRCWPGLEGLTAQLTLHGRYLAPPCLDELGMQPSTLVELRNLLAAANKGWLPIGAADEPSGTVLVHAIAQELASPDRKLVAIEPRWHASLARVTAFDRSISESDITGLDANAMLLSASPSDAVLRELAAHSVENLLVVHRSTARRPSDVARRLLALGLTPAWLALVVPVIVMRYRLRRLCHLCRVNVTPEADTAAQSQTERVVCGPPDDDVSGWLARSLRPRFRRGTGCHDCQGTAFNGALDVLDLVRLNESIRQALHAGDIETAFMRLDTSESLASRLSALVAKGEIDEDEAQRHLTRRY